jgi:L-arabinose isomerase
MRWRGYGQTQEQMIMTSNATCWFLTGSQGLYGPETLAQVEQQSRALVDHRLAQGF